MTTINLLDPEVSKSLAHHAAHLLLKRALSVAVTRLKSGVKAVGQAAAAEIGSYGCDPEITDLTAATIQELRNTIDVSLEDLATVESYWQSLPWSSRLARQDPRVRPAAPEGGDSAQSDQAAPEPLCACPNCVINRAYAAGMTAPLSTPVMPAAPEPIVSGPSPDFDPELVAAKTVLNFEYKNDVRTKQTPGVEDVSFVVGGEPVLWITAVDGTRVAVPREKLAKVVEILNVLSGGVVVGVAGDSGSQG